MYVIGWDEDHIWGTGVSNAERGDGKNIVLCGNGGLGRMVEEGDDEQTSERLREEESEIKSWGALRQ